MGPRRYQSNIRQWWSEWVEGGGKCIPFSLSHISLVHLYLLVYHRLYEPVDLHCQVHLPPLYRDVRTLGSLSTFSLSLSVSPVRVWPQTPAGRSWHSLNISPRSDTHTHECTSFFSITSAAVKKQCLWYRLVPCRLGDVPKLLNLTVELASKRAAWVTSDTESSAQEHSPVHVVLFCFVWPLVSCLLCLFVCLPAYSVFITHLCGPEWNIRVVMELCSGREVVFFFFSTFKIITWTPRLSESQQRKGSRFEHIAV